MQIGKCFISKIYPLYSSVVLGISFDITNHVHIKNENEETKDIVEWLSLSTNETVVMIEFLFWGIDIQIENK